MLFGTSDHIFNIHDVQLIIIFISLTKIKDIVENLDELPNRILPNLAHLLILCVFTVTRPTLIFPSDPMHFYTEFGYPFLLFNQQQCFIYSTASFLSKLRANKVENCIIRHFTGIFEN